MSSVTMSSVTHHFLQKGFSDNLQIVGKSLILAL